MLDCLVSSTTRSIKKPSVKTTRHSEGKMENIQHSVTQWNGPNSEHFYFVWLLLTLTLKLHSSLTSLGKFFKYKNQDKLSLFIFN